MNTKLTLQNLKQLVQKHVTQFVTVTSKVLQQNYINAAKAPGNYYDEDAVRANLPNAQRIADDIKAQTGKDVTVTTDENGNTVIKDDKGNVVATVDQNGNVVKAGAKAGAKALPKQVQLNNLVIN